LPISLGEAEQVVFKLTSWNVFFIELFQKAYPEVPLIFIDRKTEEVVASLLKSGRGFVEWFYHPTNLLQNYFLGEEKQFESLENYLFAMVEAHKKAAEKFGSETIYFWNILRFQINSKAKFCPISI